MSEEMKCRWVKSIDWWEVCEEVETVKEDDSWFWPWLGCVIRCAGYDSFTFKQDLSCECKGDWRPLLWRR